MIIAQSPTFWSSNTSDDVSNADDSDDSHSSSGDFDSSLYSTNSEELYYTSRLATNISNVFLIELWTVVYEIIVQMPHYNSSAHTDLANLIFLLRKLPAATGSDPRI